MLPLTKEEMIRLFQCVEYWLENIEQENTNKSEWTETTELRDKLRDYAGRY